MNTSARLMCKAAKGSVLCDNPTYERCNSQIIFEQHKACVSLQSDLQYTCVVIVPAIAFMYISNSSLLCCDSITVKGKEGKITVWTAKGMLQDYLDDKGSEIGMSSSLLVQRKVPSREMLDHASSTFLCSLLPRTFCQMKTQQETTKMLGSALCLRFTGLTDGALSDCINSVASIRHRGSSVIWDVVYLEEDPNFSDCYIAIVVAVDVDHKISTEKSENYRLDLFGLVSAIDQACTRKNDNAKGQDWASNESRGVQKKDGFATSNDNFDVAPNADFRKEGDSKVGMAEQNQASWQGALARGWISFSNIGHVNHPRFCYHGEAISSARKLLHRLCTCSHSERMLAVDSVTLTEHADVFADFLVDEKTISPDTEIQSNQLPSFHIISDHIFIKEDQSVSVYSTFKGDRQFRR